MRVAHRADRPIDRPRSRVLRLKAELGKVQENGRFSIPYAVTDTSPTGGSLGIRVLTLIDGGAGMEKSKEIDRSGDETAWVAAEA